MAVFQRQDALGLTSTTYAPQILAVQQSGNLYVYCSGNPVDFVDPSGEFLLVWQFKASIVAASVIIGAVMSAASYVLTTAGSGEQIDIGELFEAAFWGGFSGLVSSIMQTEPWLYGLINAIISALSVIEPGVSMSEILFSAITGAISAYIPAALGDWAKLDDVAELIVGVTAGAPVEMAGDMIEICADEVNDEPAAEEHSNDTAEDLAENAEETVESITPTEEEDDVQPEPSPAQPDPPECSGGSPGGPGNYIGSDKRPIAF